VREPSGTGEVETCGEDEKEKGETVEYVAHTSRLDFRRFNFKGQTPVDELEMDEEVSEEGSWETTTLRYM
jgi:hypothetical protein